MVAAVQGREHNARVQAAATWTSALHLRGHFGYKSSVKKIQGAARRRARAGGLSCWRPWASTNLPIGSVWTRAPSPTRGMENVREQFALADQQGRVRMIRTCCT
jgi:hypothetical protein